MNYFKERPRKKLNSKRLQREVDAADPLQRFGYVKVEGTSFTVSEPFSPLEIEPIIYTYATVGQRKILEEQFEVEPFSVNTICLERIFADKIYAGSPILIQALIGQR